MQNVINQTFVWQVSGQQGGEHISLLTQETGQSSLLSFCLLVLIMSQSTSCLGKDEKTEDSNGHQNVASCTISTQGLLLKMDYVTYVQVKNSLESF